MSDKKTNAKVSELNSLDEVKAVKAKATVFNPGKIKIKALKMIRSSFGAFNEGKVYEVDLSLANILCDGVRAERC